MKNMKGVLQSKRFRKNLYKWLLMYVGVMVFLTTVVTYSKYVSSLMASDSARAAKFNVTIAPQECTETASDGVHCNIGIHRATQTIDYYFKVQTNLEVKTDLFLTIFVNQDFELKNIEEVNGSLPPYEVTEKTIAIEGNVEHYAVYSLKAMTYLPQEEAKQEKLFKVTVKFKPIPMSMEIRIMILSEWAFQPYKLINRVVM